LEEPAINKNAKCIFDGITDVASSQSPRRLNDSKMGLPIGGEELKATEMARISKQDTFIGDAALDDDVFNFGTWGASIATPDKIGNNLNIFKPNLLEVDLGAFVSVES
jgi:hypothetical protein